MPKINYDLDPNPSYFKGDNLPVERVSWYDAQEFCQRLSQFTGKQYTLPTEAQWEYACRGGTTTPFYFGPTITSDLANYYATEFPYAEAPLGEYRKKTTPVGMFAPNPFGLFDLYGNVFEWCADPKHKNYDGSPNDDSIWAAKKTTQTRYRTLRGGGWSSDSKQCRSANRTFFSPKNKYSVIGFRVVLLP
jgi:formylglycine-generating enzyme required for sulfatase activity